MKYYLLLILIIFCSLFLSGQALEVAGTVNIGTMTPSDSDSIVVWNSDGTLGIRQSSALNKIILNALANKNETFTSDSTGTVMDIDGHVYATVKIGSQWWMAENLRTTRYSNGSAIDRANDTTRWTSAGTNGKWCWYAGDSTTYEVPYGKLYNWHAVANSRGLCPSGWHVPSDVVGGDSEWQTLENYLSPHAGTKMKTTSGWKNDNGTNTNMSGFSALPGGGRRSTNGTFFDSDYNGYWWGSSQHNNTDDVRLRILNEGVGCYPGFSPKEMGFSVRCLRD